MLTQSFFKAADSSIQIRFISEKHKDIYKNKSHFRLQLPFLAPRSRTPKHNTGHHAVKTQWMDKACIYEHAVVPQCGWVYRFSLLPAVSLHLTDDGDYTKLKAGIADLEACSTQLDKTTHCGITSSSTFGRQYTKPFHFIFLQNTRLFFPSNECNSKNQTWRN